MIAALVLDPVDRQPTPRAVPLPTLPAPSLPRAHAPDTLLVGVARIDRSGHIHERAPLSALGWMPGRDLELDTIHGMIVIAALPGGRYHVDQRGALALPATARRMCGITETSPVVLAAAVHDQLLIVHPARTVARLLATHYTDLTGAHNGS